MKHIVIGLLDEHYDKIVDSATHNAIYLDLYQIMQIAIVGGTVLPDNPTNIKHEPMSVIEDIKAEISDAIENDNDIYGWYNGLYKALEIIDKHISEEDCRDCDKWKECECGEKGHANSTSQGYSIGECRDFQHISRKE